MKHLWAAWRMKYIDKSEKEQGCVFCNALAKADSPANLIVTRGERAFVILNKFPYTSGHVMVAPLAHAASLEALDPATRAEMMELVSQASIILGKVYRPQGFNIGINMGEAAGAGVPGHIHIQSLGTWEKTSLSTGASIRVSSANTPAFSKSRSNPSD